MKTTTRPRPSLVAGEVIRRGAWWFARFDPLLAPTIASWARDGRDLFWLAPKTPGPLTAAKVVGWASPDGQPLLFQGVGQLEPFGYLEINPMPSDFGHFWLGHCVIDPSRRGSGFGQCMISLSLELAFRVKHACRISLVVFPDNIGAIRCYQRAGFVNSGEQLKYFPTTGKQHRMTQMTIDRGRFLSLPTHSALRG